KTINCRINTSNLPLIIRELFKDNIICGRSLLARKHFISSFCQTYQQNDKINCLIITTKMYSLLFFYLVTRYSSITNACILLDNSTDDSVELPIEVFKECEQILSQISPHELDSVFSTLNTLIHESSLDKRT
ncbi:unnamed protein product, partial [Rotaria sp. Silwood2]